MGPHRGQATNSHECALHPALPGGVSSDPPAWMVNNRPTSAGRFASMRGAFEVVAEAGGVDNDSLILIEAVAKATQSDNFPSKGLRRPAFSERGASMR